MKHPLLMLILIAVFSGCQESPLSTADAINADPDAFMDEEVRIQGKLVKPNSNVIYVTTGLLRYFVLEDDSGKIRVFYNVASRRCPPRMGARVSVAGKIILSGPDQNPIFVAKSFSIDEQAPLAKNQIRMCQLNLQEAQAHAEGGEEGLKDFWRSAGKPLKELVYD